MSVGTSSVHKNLRQSYLDVSLLLLSFKNKCRFSLVDLSSHFPFPNPMSLFSQSIFLYYLSFSFPVYYTFFTFFNHVS